MVWTSSGTGDGSFTNDEICGCRGVTLAFDCLLSFSGTAPDEFPKSMWIDGRCEVQIVKALETSKSSTPRADKAKPGGNSTMNMKDSLLQPVPPSRVHYCCHLRGVECLKETSECRCPLTYPLCPWRDRQAIFVKPTRTGWLQVIKIRCTLLCHCQLYNCDAAAESLMCRVACHFDPRRGLQTTSSHVFSNVA